MGNGDSGLGSAGAPSSVPLHSAHYERASEKH
jgi:hypothetical protein